MSEYAPTITWEYPGNVVLEADTTEAFERALQLLRDEGFPAIDDNVTLIREGSEIVGVLCGPSVETVRQTVAGIRTASR